MNPLKFAPFRVFFFNGGATLKTREGGGWCGMGSPSLRFSFWVAFGFGTGFGSAFGLELGEAVILVGGRAIPHAAFDVTF